MADLKKLIGNALNKANSSKPSDNGKKGYSNVASTKTSRPAPIQAAVDKRNKEQAKWNKEYKEQKADLNYGNKDFGKKDVLGVSYNQDKFGKSESGKYKRPDENARFRSPALKEEISKEVKRVTSPGGLVKELKSGKKSIAQEEKNLYYGGVPVAKREKKGKTQVFKVN
jgi:hypothetical protein